METWILHIQTQDCGDDNIQPNLRNKFTAWASEKQAIKAAGSFIKEECQVWHLDIVLLHSAHALIDQDKIPLAIKLINLYSQFDATGVHPKTRLKQINISIIKSTFLGSAFE